MAPQLDPATPARFVEGQRLTAADLNDRLVDEIRALKTENARLWAAIAALTAKPPPKARQYGERDVNPTA